MKLTVKNTLNRAVMGNISIDVKAFGAVGDGVTDDTQAFKKGIAALKGNGNLIIPGSSGAYVLSDTLNITRNISLSGEAPGVELKFTKLTGTKAAISVSVGPAFGEYKKVMSNIALIGSDAALKSGKSYPESNDVAAGTIGLQLNAQQIELENITLLGFDKGVAFGNNAYLINFQNCVFRYNNYGIFFDAANKSNLGENIAFNNCVTANNINGLYNYLGELIFNLSSLDYNKVHVKYNQTKAGGVASGKLSFMGCHFESTQPGTKIFNNGHLSITGGTMWSETNTGGYIVNTGEGELHLTDVLLRTPDEVNYYITGNKPVISNISFISTSQLIRLHPSLGYMPNGDFENNNWGLKYWTTLHGKATISSARSKIGEYSLKLTATDSNGGQIMSPRIYFPADKRELYVGMFFYNRGSVAAGSYTINEYGYDNQLTNSTNIFVPLNTKDTFDEARSNWISLHPVTGYLVIQLNACAGSTSVTYYDGLYIWLR